MKICGLPTECYSRIVGYFRPLEVWNPGKLAEFRDRKTYDADKAVKRIKAEKEKANERS